MVLVGVIAAGFILVIICLYEIDSRLGELSYVLDGIDSPFEKAIRPDFFEIQREWLDGTARRASRKPPITTP